MKITVRKHQLELAERLKKLSDKSTMDKVAKAMGEEALRVSIANAESNVNATGKKWAPTKNGSRLSWMVGAIAVVFENMKFAIVANNPFAYFQIKGARKRGTNWKIPARSFSPKSGSISSRFRSVLEAGDNVIRSIMGNK